MGTYYVVTFEGDSPINVQEDIEKELLDFNQALSTYIPNSTLSLLNQSKEGILIPEAEKHYFIPVLEASESLNEKTDGALNAYISPVVNHWGFGYKGKAVENTNEVIIDSLLSIVHNSNFRVELQEQGIFIHKSIPNAEADYSSLAKGYAIDVLASYLDKKKIQNYLIDIGGEARANGVNNTGNTWTLAINSPNDKSETNTMELALKLENKSMATSGNYRQYYISEGKKYAHIIDPATGYPALKDILSATIIAEDCMTADGLATAMMVKGLEDAKVFLASHEYPACLIYDADGDDKLERYYANGFENLVLF